MATFYDVPPEIKGEITAYLEPSEIARFAKTGRIRGLKPTLEQCCIEPNQTELFRLIQAWRNDEIQLAQRQRKTSLVLETDGGVIIELLPRFDEETWKAKITFPRGYPTEVRYTTEEIREILVNAKLYFPNGENIKYFMWILRQRDLCVREVPNFIQRCLYNWLFLRTEKSRTPISAGLAALMTHPRLISDWITVYNALSVLLPRDFKVMDYWLIVSAEIDKNILKPKVDLGEIIKSMTLEMLVLTEPQDYNVAAYHLL